MNSRGMPERRNKLTTKTVAKKKEISRQFVLHTKAIECLSQY